MSPVNSSTVQITGHDVVKVKGLDEVDTCYWMSSSNKDAQSTGICYWSVVQYVEAFQKTAVPSPSEEVGQDRIAL